MKNVNYLNPSTTRIISKRLDNASSISLSIIIASHNNITELTTTLSNLINGKTNETEIIVVAAGCTDGTYDKVVVKFPHISVINCQDVGWGEANNIGTIFSRGEYLLFLGDDCVGKGNWLEELLDFAKHSDDFGSIGSVVEFPESGTYWVGGEIRRSIPRVRLNIFNSFEPIKNHLSRRVGFLPFPLIRKRVFQEVGGFDPEYFYLYDDPDLGMRLTLSEYTNYCINNSVIATTGSKAEGTPKKHYFGVRNELRFLLKFSSTVMLIPGFIIFSFGLFLYLFLRADHRFIKKTIEAIKWNVLQFREIRKFRP